MALSFRQRIFAWLVAIAVLPAAIAIAYALFTSRLELPTGGARAWEDAAASFRDLRAGLNQRTLSPGARLALARHGQQLSVAVRHVRQAEAISAAVNGILAGAALALAVLVFGGAVRLAGHLARQLSRPIDELVSWTELIRRGERIPDDPPARGAPEFDVLRTALRGMAAELDRARAREVEAAELRAFRDLAKNVAHELKNPLTPIRFAVERLRREAPAAPAELLDVLEAESGRLEQMARDFAELGRLPEGPAAPVDVGELLDELARGGPGDVPVRVEKARDVPLVSGHYEPLRRAIHNLLINAVDAVHERQEAERRGRAPGARGDQETAGGGSRAPAGGGEVTLAVRPAPNGDRPAVEITVRDTGAGIRPDDLARVFEPHFTTKARGTGLGLAIARSTIRHHGGTIRVTSERGRGTTVTVVLPAGPERAA